MMIMKLKGPYLGFLILIIVTTINLGDAVSLLANNNTIKTIKSEDGDVIDCVDISRQPAFDHPLLKDHTIKLLQMKPSNHPDVSIESHGNKNQITQLWQKSGECPEGTIPIRRTTDTQMSSATKKPRNFNISSSSTLVGTNAVNQLRHEYAYTYTGRGNYYGAKATISAWNPYVEGAREFSLSQLWIVAGSGSNLNTIEVGWIVNPLVFNDYRTRLFVYWTRDNYGSTGCYHLRCSGFVQLTNRIAIGSSIVTTGTQPEISLLVWKDVRQNVWWLQYNGIIVGYWPGTLFTTLRNSGSLVEWGGEIINSNPNGRHTATDMGSGLFAGAGFRRASYFRNLLVVNNANTLISPPSIGSAVTNARCYNIAVGKSVNWGHYFYYGGPGRNPNCP